MGAFSVWLDLTARWNLVYNTDDGIFMIYNIFQTISTGPVERGYNEGTNSDDGESSSPVLYSSDVAEAVLFILSTAPHVQV